MQRVNVFEEIFEICQLFEKPVLFTDSRVDRKSLPEGVYLYEIRHDDSGNPATLEQAVRVDFYGSVLSKVPFDFKDSDYLSIGNEDFGFESERALLQEYV